MDVTSISAALTTLKATFELGKNAIAARDDQKISEATQALNDRIIDVQNAALALQEKHSAARDEIDRLKDELREARGRLQALESDLGERGSYELVPVVSGGFAYRSKADSGAQQHYICQPCFDGPEKRKVLLRHRPRQTGTYAYWACPVCNTKLVDHGR